MPRLPEGAPGIHWADREPRSRGVAFVRTVIVGLSLVTSLGAQERRESPPARASILWSEFDFATASPAARGAFDLGDVALPPAVQIRGVVRGADGQPIRGGAGRVRRHSDPATPFSRFASYAEGPKAGVALGDGRREVVLFLPEIRTRLLVHSNLPALLGEPSVFPASAPEPLAVHELTPRAGEVHRVEITVGAASRRDD